MKKKTIVGQQGLCSIQKQNHTKKILKDVGQELFFHISVRLHTIEQSFLSDDIIQLCTSWPKP